ncbi:MAG: dephospho-CoA kinase [Acidimicrobiia bacterium]|nr:dephospho-CoA kinase [Acidimicrobiia bacterium]
MLVVGLTGGIGAGKTSVAHRFGELGAVVIDVDAIGREVLEPQNPAAQAVIEVFGQKIIDKNGNIDRAKLAAEVFAQPERLKALEIISHPAINAVLEQRLAAFAERVDVDVVVLDMAVLIESCLGQLPSGKGYSRVVVVEAPEEVRMRRLIRRGLNKQQAKARMDSQASDRQRRALANYVIHNNGSLDDLADAVDKVWDKLISNHAISIQ